MKRDMDLARKILLEIEESEVDSEIQITAQEAENQAVLDYHIALLVDARLIQANKTFFDDGSAPWNIERLTWEGHEFLDAARNQNVWSKVKEVARDQGGSLPFDVLKALAIQFARQAVGL